MKPEPTMMLNIVASRTRNEGFRRFFAVFFLTHLLALISINLRLLE